MSRTPKTARKHATRPAGIPIDPAAETPRTRHTTQPVPAAEAPPPMTQTRSHRVRQPLDPVEFSGTMLADIRERWKAAGSLLPEPAESQRLLAEYKRAHGVTEERRKALLEATEKEEKAILALARAFGGTSLRIDNVVHDFACRGETIFFRRRNIGVIDT